MEEGEVIEMVDFKLGGDAGTGARDKLRGDLLHGAGGCLLDLVGVEVGDK